MTDKVWVIKNPYILIPSTSTLEQVDYFGGMTVADATKEAQADLGRQGFTEFVYSLNDQENVSPDSLVQPWDFAAITVRHGIPAAFFVGLGMTAFWASVTAFAVNTVLMIGAGLLINTIMAPAQANTTDNSKSSYGWNGGINETGAGSPMPVVYGEPYSTPPIIGSYRTVDTDYSMWQWILLIAAAGQTTSPITETDIIIGEEKLTAYSDYRFGVTDGSTTITDTTRTALSAFAAVRHDRSFDKRIQHDDASSPAAAILLDLNIAAWSANHAYTLNTFMVLATPNGYCYECTTAGESGSTEPVSPPTTPGTTFTDGTVTWTCRNYSSASIVDMSGRGSPWTKHNGAAIIHDNTAWGGFCLHLPADNDYIDSDDFEALRLDAAGEIEFRFRIPDTGDRVLFGQQIQVDGESGTDNSIFSVSYISGKLCVQNYSGYGPSIDAVGYWTKHIDLSYAVTLVADTWYYCRIQSGYDAANDRYINDLLIQSGSTLAIIDYDQDGAYYNPDTGKSATLVNYSSEDADQKALYTQQFGSGWYYDGSVVTQLYGKCDFDAIRTTRGLAHSLSDRSLPLTDFSELVESSDYFTLRTKSKVNSVMIILEYAQGLFQLNDKGDIRTKIVNFDYDYRKVGDPTWTTSTISMAGSTTKGARFQWQLFFADWAQYDIRLRRQTSEDDNSGKMHSESYLISFQEIINIRQCYPGLQMVSIGVKASDSRSGQLGAIKIKHHRTTITVPGWDGTGTQSVDATIPMWQLYDMFTNSHYGEAISPTEILQSKWTEWSTWTTGLIDGYKRAQSHIVFDEKGSLADAIAKIEQVGRARIIRVGSDWSVIVDKPKTPQYLFSSGNINKNSFEWSSYEESEKSDAVEVVFWNDDKQGARDSRMAKCPGYETLGRIPKVSQIEVRGIVTAEQALREAQFRLNKNLYVTRQGKHQCGFQSSPIELGDTFYLVPPSLNYLAGGRLSLDADGSDLFTLDQTVILSEPLFSGKLKLFFINSDGELVTINVIGPWDTPTRTIQIAASSWGERFDVFGLGRISEDRLINQVLKKTINPSAKNVDFEWCEYSDSIFYDPNYGGGLLAI